MHGLKGEQVCLKLLKIVKARHLNRLRSAMLECLLHVAINGPKVNESQPIVKKAVKRWLQKKPRRKMGKSSAVDQSTPKSVSVLTETHELSILLRTLSELSGCESDDSKLSGGESDDSYGDLDDL
ncbi:hypothetical protein DPMN_085633 [Dreissena polymorpha]|uniref:Uncharacterized protein n=1 Tax=Dreissena polymorpha TaxID=45954 RepID=A0A9D3YGF5_DREPO|nr:hypothetical protein DPMN_085633 [Dreissena polymorpha]